MRDQRRKHTHFLKAGAWVTAASVFFSSFAYALPSGLVVESGSATVDDSVANVLTITASDNAILGWGSFSIGAGESVNFVLQDSSASVLSRDLSGSSSSIDGGLFSNGNVYLINPFGITFGDNAHVQAQSFVASTLDIQNAMFLAGDLTGEYAFSQNPGIQGAIINDGLIEAGAGGHVVLMAQEVINNGTIQADLGEVVLAAGKTAALSFDAEGMIQVAITEPLAARITQGSAPVQNTGTLKANGGRVTLTIRDIDDALTESINNTGLIQATRVLERDGVVELVAEDATVVSTGDVHATDLIIREGTALQANGGRLTIEGDWKNYGSFTATDSTVEFAGSGNTHTILGNNTFSTLYARGADRILYFESGMLQTVTTRLDLEGAFAHLIKIHPTLAGEAFLMDVQGVSYLNFVDVKDSYQLGGDRILITRSHSDGNIQGWIADPVWTNGNATGIWSDGFNWDTGVAPGAGNDVTFDATSTADSQMDADFTINSLTISSGYTGTLTLSNNLTIINNYSQANGSVTANGTFDVGGTFTMTGGDGSAGAAGVGGDAGTSAAFSAAGSFEVDGAMTLQGGNGGTGGSGDGVGVSGSAGGDGGSVSFAASAGVTVGGALTLNGGSGGNGGAASLADTGGGGGQGGNASFTAGGSAISLGSLVLSGGSGGAAGTLSTAAAEGAGGVGGGAAYVGAAGGLVITGVMNLTGGTGGEGGGTNTGATGGTALFLSQTGDLSVGGSVTITGGAGGNGRVGDSGGDGGTGLDDGAGHGSDGSVGTAGMQQSGTGGEASLSYAGSAGKTFSVTVNLNVQGGESGAGGNGGSGGNGGNGGNGGAGSDGGSGGNGGAGNAGGQGGNGAAGTLNLSSANSGASLTVGGDLVVLGGAGDHGGNGGQGGNGGNGGNSGGPGDMTLGGQAGNGGGGGQGAGGGTGGAGVVTGGSMAIGVTGNVSAVAGSAGSAGSAGTAGSAGANGADGGDGGSGNPGGSAGTAAAGGSAGSAGAGGTTIITGTSGILSVGGNWSNAGSFTHNSGTVRFTATDAGNTIADGGSDWYNMIFNGAGGAWSFSDSTTIGNDLTVTAGTLNGTNDITVNGGDVTGNGTINLTGGTLLLDAAGNFGGNTGWTFNNLTFGNGAGVTTTTKTGSNTITVSGALSVAASQTLNAGDDAWNVTGDLAVAGTLSGTGDVTVNGGDVTGNGTINLTGGTFLLDGAGNFGGNTGWTFYDLTFGNGAGATTSTKTGSGAVTVSNDFAIAANQTLDAGDDTWNVAGDWSNSGTFTASTSSVVFNGADQSLTGDTTFYNFTKNVTVARTLTFGAGSTTAVTNALDLQGAAGNLLSLRSSIDGTEWDFSPQGAVTIDFLDVKDSNNTSGTEIDARAANSVNSGNNTAWNFGDSAEGGGDESEAPPVGPILDVIAKPGLDGPSDEGDDETGDEPSEPYADTEPAEEGSDWEELPPYFEVLAEMDPENVREIAPFLNHDTTDILEDKATRRVLIADGAEDRILVVDLESGEIITTLQTGQMPVDMVLSEDKTSVFVYSLLDGTVSQIDLDSGHTLQTFQVGDPGTRVGLSMTSEGLVITSPDGRPITTLRPTFR